MAESSETQVATGSDSSRESKALAIARAAGGIKTSRDFSRVMSHMMVDLLEGVVNPRLGNAVCNAGGKLLKMAELELRYGRPKADESAPEGDKMLTLAGV
mgnify:CR=1 FL=1